jgi:pyruvate kinase
MDQRATRTSIVCTIGPASRGRDTLRAMIEAGMNVARLNFAHGDLPEHAATIAEIRTAAKAARRRVAILADLPGPKLRIGRLAEQPVELERGHRFTLAVGDFTGNATRASTDFCKLPQVVKPGDTIFLNDGLVQLVVETVSDDAVLCEVAVGGTLLSNKGINIPDVDLGISAFTARDRECLAFALEQGADAVGQSFVQTAADVAAVRDAVRAAGRETLIIAKIERARALERIDEILAAADGVMVARGDLGVEIPIEGIAITQKELIEKANWLAKPAITATQMLLSMVESRRPTRAEVSDVTNAILDGTDCVMLSEESAIGAHPVRAVRMLSRIAQLTEPHIAPRPEPELESANGTVDNQELVAASVAGMALRMRPVGIVVPTDTGAMARRVAVPTARVADRRQHLGGDLPRAAVRLWGRGGASAGSPPLMARVRPRPLQGSAAGRAGGRPHSADRGCRDRRGDGEPTRADRAVIPPPLG